MNLISLTETANLLNVSKETLRNWDKSGKLKPTRNSNNNYRTYDKDEVLRLRDQILTQATLQGFESTMSEVALVEEKIATKDIKRGISKLHRILRDTEGNSSIIERFDEVTKLFFLKISHERGNAFPDGDSLFESTSRSYPAGIRAAFTDLVSQNSDLFPEKFRTIRLGDEALTATGRALGEMDLSATASDAKGIAYEEMVKNTFDKGDNQQFFTPPSVVEFMVGLLGKGALGSICDPACGTGGFLVEITKQQLDVANLLGFEIDERLAWVAGINLLAHQADKFSTQVLGSGGSLGPEAKSFFGSFDVVITNPPFGSDYSDKEELNSYILGSGKNSRRRGILFIERSLQLLRPGGTFTVVIDNGLLSLPSAADVRALIFAQAEVLAVISLPDSAFQPYASVSTSILHLRKCSPESDYNGKIFYAAVENVGRKPNGEIDTIFSDDGSSHLNNELPGILDAWNEYQEGRVFAASTADIYISDVTERDELSDGKQKRLDFPYYHPSRVAAQQAISNTAFKLARLADLVAVRNETYVPSVDLADQIINYTGLAHIAPRIGIANQVKTQANSLSSGVRRYVKGDILFAKMRPNLRKIALIDVFDQGYASGECVVLKPVEINGVPIIKPELLAILLRSDFVYGQIIHLIAGIGRPRINSKDLMNVRIPLPTLETQEALLSDFKQQHAEYVGMKEQASALQRQALLLEQSAVENIATGFLHGLGIKR